MSAEGHDHAHDHAHDHHEHHHKDTFITKYIFSIDHKMIAKQYLITGIIMGCIGVGMSMLFRMQLAWPELCRYPRKKLNILKDCSGQASCILKSIDIPTPMHPMMIPVIRYCLAIIL